MEMSEFKVRIKITSYYDEVIEADNATDAHKKYKDMWYNEETNPTEDYYAYSWDIVSVHKERKVLNREEG